MDSPFDGSTLADLRTRTSEKWRRHPADVLPAFVAEMDAPVAPAVVRALTSAIERGDTGYPSGQAYAHAMAGFAAERWDWAPDVAAMRLVPDVMSGLVEIVGLVTSPGDAVIVNPPVYPPFYGFMTHAGRRVVEAPLGADGRLDLEVLDHAMGVAASVGRAAYLLCSPHNPTGTVHTSDELHAVAELAEAHGVRVVADEIHAPLVVPGASFVPYLSVRGASRGFAVLSASKAWNLAGIKAALAVAGPDAQAELARLPEHVGAGASHLGVIAHVAALEGGGDWLDAVREAVAANQRLAVELIGRHLPEVGVQVGPGTYFAWLDCRELGIGDDPAAVFLEHGRVALTSGGAFGTGGAGHARLVLATSPAILTQAVERMADAVVVDRGRRVSRSRS